MTIIYGAFCLISFPILTLDTRYKFIKFWCMHFVYMAKLICKIDYKIHNFDILQNLYTQNKSIIILSNHQSAWETIAFIALFPQKLSYIFKKELLYIPFFGWTMALLDMMHIDRKKGARAFIYLSKQIKDKIQRNNIPVIFPQGTRALPHQDIPYKTGGVRLAVQNNLDIVPISHNAGQIWPKNSFIKKAGTINIVINPIIYIENISIESLNKQITQTIEQNIRYN